MPWELLSLDRKFSRNQKSVDIPSKFNVTSLFRLAEQEYRDFFGDDLCQAIAKRDLENGYYYSYPSEDMRDRLFKQIVMARFLTSRSFPDDLQRIY